MICRCISTGRQLFLLAALSLFASATAWADGPPASDADAQPKVVARSLSILKPELTLSGLDEKAALAKSQGAVGREVGDFVLLARDGKPVELSSLRGKPLLVNFIYTGCFHACPTMTRSLEKAVAETVAVMGAERFNIISIGFNQPFDTPQAMQDFAARYGIRQPNWYFLSPAQAILPALTQNFGFSYFATAAGFDHLNQVTLVDASGRIVRQVYGETFTPQMLAEPLKMLIAGSPLPVEQGTVNELLERFRILCSVYDPKTGRYRTDYSIYMMVAGFITFLIFLVVLMRHFWRNRRRTGSTN